MRVLIVASALTMSVLLMGCAKGGGSSACSRLVGNWEAYNYKMTISQNGDSFVIQETPQHFGSMSMTAAGPCTNGMIATGGMSGNLVYLPESNQITFMGVGYSRPQS